MAINSLNSSSHGLAGLMSGMDTQSMVDALLSGTQAKIDKQNSRKATLTMKQEMYHNIITQLTNLKNSYFSFTSKSTNLLSSSFFNAMTATTKSDLFKVTASSNASTGNMKIDYIKKLAQATAHRSNVTAAGALEGKVDAAALAKLKDSVKAGITVTVNDGTTDRTVTISDVNALIAGKSGIDAAKALTDSAEFSSLGIKVELGENNTFRFTAPTAGGNPQKITVSGANAKGNELIGGAVTGTGEVAPKLKLDGLNPSIEVAYNGVSKSISFDYSASSAADIAASLEKSLDKAFGDVITVTGDGTGKLNFQTGASNQVTIKGSQAALKALGIQAGASNKVNLDMEIGDINFATSLSSKNFQFSINDVAFNFSADKSMNAIMTEINNSKAGVKVGYSTVENKFTIESTVMGVTPDIEMSQTEGNLLTAMFGVESSTGARGDKLFEQNAIVGSNALNIPADYKGGKLKLTVNGSAYEITIPAKKDADGKALPATDPNAIYSESEFVTELNKQLSSTFGKNDADIANVRVSMQGDKLKLEAERGYAVTMADTDTVNMLGFTAGDTTTQKATGASTLGQLGMSGTLTIGSANISLSAGKTVNQLLTEMNSALGGGANGRAEFEESTGRFRFFGVDIPMSATAGSGADQIFGGTSFNPNSAEVAMELTRAGQNAVVSINGTEIERTSNSFTHEGLEITLLEESTFDASGNPVSPAGMIETSRNTEDVYDGIVKFVEDYNKILDNLNTLMTDKPTYKEYPPLTSEQKAAMTDSEIKLWEEKSRIGLLRSDPTLQGILGEMRSVLLAKPEGSSVALYDIGINTYYDGVASNTGKLEIDEDVLRAALAEKPEDIRKLFTSNDGGVSTQMLGALEHAISSNTTSPNSLIRIAGQAGRFDANSNIYKEIKEINESLTKLNKTYKMEYNRYWRQFNAMEQVIANMNSQSSWLSQQLG